MTDLKEQLRAYFDVADPPFDTAELMREPLPELSPNRSRVGRGVLVAAATAVVILLVAGLPLLLFGGREETVVEPSTITAPPTTVSLPAHTVPEDVMTLLGCLPLDPSGWSQSDPLPLPLLDGGQLAANDSVAVVVGEGTGGVVAYWSRDGLDWEPVEIFPDAPNADSPIIAGGTKGFVVVAQGPFVPDQESPAVVAFSADGITWEHMDPESLPTQNATWLYDVIAGPDGFIIVGASGEGSLAWYSADGRTWVDSGLPTDEFYPLAVVPTESGWAAMTTPSGTQDSVNEPNPKKWESSDGTTWHETETQNAPPPLQFVGYMRQSPQVTVNGTWVLVNESNEHLDVAWVSNDNGTTWNEYPIGNELASAETAFFDLDVTPFGLLLAGRHDPPAAAATNVLYYSEDGGMTWDTCPANLGRARSTEITQIAMLGDKLVMFDDYTGPFYRWTNPATAP